MRRSCLAGGKGGFSLTEILVVMTIVALLATLSVQSVSSMYQSNRIDGNIAVLSGLMERAHQAAVAHNCYVYVALTDNPPASSPTTGISALLFAAQDGSDILANFTVGTTASPMVVSADNGFRILDAVQTFPGMMISNAGMVTSVANLPSVTPTPASLQGGMSLGLNHGGRTYTFTRVIEYLPDGESKVSTWNNWVEFGVQSAMANSGQNNAVARLSKLTGKLTIYRQ